MRDESIAANQTKSGTRLKTCSDSARFSWTKIRRKLGGRLSGHTGFERKQERWRLPKGATQAQSYSATL
jgi:hypothetical protein